ncbi:phosphatase inhibitor-domain-containing protein [Chytridium lagenaria]|nr:phosphatase inhibitor-domain-containing protein [Chytridium lagenaria]
MTQHTAISSTPSATTTATVTATATSTHTDTVGSLFLRGGPVESRRVQWASNVEDNEGMGRKTSKVCCIFHPQRQFGDSSSDESTSDSDGSDSPNAYERQPKIKNHRKKKTKKGCGHDHKHDGPSAEPCAPPSPPSS